MARDELDLSDYRPSRLPRVLLITSALASGARSFEAAVVVTPQQPTILDRQIQNMHPGHKPER